MLCIGWVENDDRWGLGWLWITMMCDGRGGVPLKRLVLYDNIAFVESVLSFHFMSLNELLPFLWCVSGNMSFTIGCWPVMRHTCSAALQVGFSQGWNREETGCKYSCDRRQAHAGLSEQFCWKETVWGAIVYMSQGFAPESSVYKRETRHKQERKESMCRSFVWCCRIETSTLWSRTLWTFHKAPLTFLTTVIVLDGFPFHWIYAFFLVHVLSFTCRGQGWVSLRWLTTKSQLRTIDSWKMVSLK